MRETRERGPSGLNVFRKTSRLPAFQGGWQAGSDRAGLSLVYLPRHPESQLSKLSTCRKLSFQINMHTSEFPPLGNEVGGASVLSSFFFALFFPQGVFT